MDEKKAVHWVWQMADWRVASKDERMVALKAALTAYPWVALLGCWWADLMAVEWDCWWVE